MEKSAFQPEAGQKAAPTLAHPVTSHSMFRGSFSFVKEFKRLMNRVEFSTINTTNRRDSIWWADAELEKVRGCMCAGHT